jgi:hypothetical protein
MHLIDERKSQTAQLCIFSSALHARIYLNDGEPWSAFHAERLINKDMGNFIIKWSETSYNSNSHSEGAELSGMGLKSLKSEREEAIE